jgi:hypothetical protein
MESDDLLIDPTPNPTATPYSDPFAPDPTIFPPAPDWLFPATMVLLGVIIVVVLILLYGWYKSVQYNKAEQAARPPTEWVDLSKLGKKGRWADASDDGPRPPKTRADEIDEHDPDDGGPGGPNGGHDPDGDIPRA